MQCSVMEVCSNISVLASQKGNPGQLKKQIQRENCQSTTKHKSREVWRVASTNSTKVCGGVGYIGAPSGTFSQVKKDPRLGFPASFLGFLSDLQVSTSTGTKGDISHMTRVQ